MQQREYHIIVHSFWRVIIVAFLFMLTTISIGRQYVNIENDSVVALLCFPIIAIAYFIGHLLGHAKVKIIFTNEAFVHIWKKKYFLSWQKDIQIPWSSINTFEDYDYKRLFEGFHINYSNKRKYSIYRLIGTPIKDDRDAMIADFRRYSNDYRRAAMQENFTLIQEKDSVHQELQTLFYFMSAAFMLFLILSLFFSKNNISWGALLFFGSGSALFYWLMRSQKKRT